MGAGPDDPLTVPTADLAEYQHHTCDAFVWTIWPNIFSARLHRLFNSHPTFFGDSPMTLTAADQKRIIEKESAWTDPAFGGIDLSQFPSLQPLPPERTRDDGRFARHWDDTPLSVSASALRNFVSDPDAESLERVGDEIGHEGFRNEVRQRKGESVCARFKASCPDYLPTDTNPTALNLPNVQTSLRPIRCAKR